MGRFLFFNFIEAGCVLCLFLMVPWVGLQSVSVAFPSHANILTCFSSQIRWVVDGL